MTINIFERSFDDAGQQWAMAAVPNDVPSLEVMDMQQAAPQPEPTMMEQVGQVASEVGQAVMDVARPVVEPFLPGSPVENPVARGVVQGAAVKTPNNLTSLIYDIWNVAGLPEANAPQVPDFIGPSEAYPNAQTAVSGITQFLIPFKALGGFNAKPMSIESLAAGAGADALFDPVEGNLATMARSMGFDNELTQYLDSKVGEDADALERLNARMKQSLEGMGLSLPLETLTRGVQAAKAWYKGKGTGNAVVPKKKDQNLIEGFDVSVQSLVNNALTNDIGTSVPGVLKRYVDMFSGKEKLGGRLCHNKACQYLSKNGIQEGDKVVLLRVGNDKQVGHSMILDKDNNPRVGAGDGVWDKESMTLRIKAHGGEKVYSYIGEVPLQDIDDAAMQIKGAK